MNWLDLALLALIAVAAFTGYRSGMIRMAVSFVAVMIGTTLASRFGDDIRPVIALVTDNQQAQQLGGFVLVLMIVMLLGIVASGSVAKVLTAIKLAWVDKLGGLALGVLLVMMAFSAALANVQEFAVLNTDETIASSAVGTFLADNFDVVLRTVRLVPNDYGHY